jgi:hypothetical protein
MELGSDAKRAPVPTIASRRGRFIGRYDADTSRLTGAIPRGRAPWLAAAVLASVLVVAVALAWTSRSLYEHNERRLVNSRVRGLGLVLAGAVPAIQTPLASGAATKGVKHAHSDFKVSIVDSGGEIRVEMTNTGRGQPVLRSPASLEPSGRKLRIVDALSGAWATAESPHGKTVWFTLASNAKAAG